MSSAVNDDDGAQWTRPAVQPQDVAEILVGPLSAARGIYAGANTSTSHHQQQFQEMAPPQARHKPTSKPPKSSKKGLLPYAHSNPLLTKRVWRLQEYITDFHTRPKGQKKYHPGEPPTPIPVPLRYGEKYHEYESKFVAWLAKKNIRLSDLKDDPNHERSLRNNFANMRVATPTGHPLPAPPRLEVTLADNSYSSFKPQLPQFTKPRKRDRSQSPPARRKRSARVVLQEEDKGYYNNNNSNNNNNNNASYDTEPPRKIHLQREWPLSSPVRSTASSSSSSYFKHPGEEQFATTPHRPTEVHTIAAAVPPSPTSSAAPTRPADVAPPKTVTPVKDEEKCVAKLPGARAPTTAFIAAYVSCNCRQCMQDWNLMLTDRLSALENEMCAMRKLQLQQQATASADKREYSQQQQEQDIQKSTKQEDLKMQSATELVAIKHKAADGGSKEPSSTMVSKTNESIHTAEMKTAETDSSSHCESRTVGGAAGEGNQASNTEDTCSSKSGGAEPSRKVLLTVSTIVATAKVPTGSSISSSSSSSTIGALADDPIKARMVDEYNALNEQILLNEKVMADSLQRVQATMLTDMAGAMQEHQQIQQIQAVIQSGVASRNKALAILIAYCWAYKQVELFEQIDKLGTFNIAHVQGVSHAKCARFNSQIECKYEFLASLKEMLDQIILTGGSSSSSSNDGDGSSTLSNCGIDELNGLGRQIVLEEQALAALEQERMDEFMRLFQFSYEIRTSCRAILDGGDG